MVRGYWLCYLLIAEFRSRREADTGVPSARGYSWFARDGVEACAPSGGVQAQRYFTGFEPT